MAGAPCDMKAIMAIARRHKLPVLEDCAQANGGTFQGRMLGTFGAVGMFSLQWNKNATAGEGGLIVTNDAKLYERCNAAHDLGIPWVNGAASETGAVAWGGGRRMSELTGAVGAVQLRKLPAIIRHMRASKRRIKAQLEGMPGLAFRRLNDEAGDTGPFLILLLEDEARAKVVVQRMQAAGLDTAVRLAEYGLHIYFNIPQLVSQIPLSPAGNPWSLPENTRSSARLPQRRLSAQRRVVRALHSLAHPLAPDPGAGGRRGGDHPRGGLLNGYVGQPRAGRTVQIPIDGASPGGRERS